MIANNIIIIIFILPAPIGETKNLQEYKAFNMLKIALLFGCFKICIYLNNKIFYFQCNVCYFIRMFYKMFNWFAAQYK